ncbi:unnamed protein product, partial [Prorocentrum cordatum]
QGCRHPARLRPGPRHPPWGPGAAAPDLPAGRRSAAASARRASARLLAPPGSSAGTGGLQLGDHAGVAGSAERGDSAVPAPAVGDGGPAASGAAGARPRRRGPGAGPPAGARRREEAEDLPAAHAAEPEPGGEPHAADPGAVRGSLRLEARPRCHWRAAEFRLRAARLRGGRLEGVHVLGRAEAVRTGGQGARGGTP